MHMQFKSCLQLVNQFLRHARHSMLYTTVVEESLSDAQLCAPVMELL